MNPNQENQSLDQSLTRHTGPFGIALALSCVVNALLVVAKEKSPALLGLMQKITGHHWVTHSAFVVVLFLATGWLLSRANRNRGEIGGGNKLAAGRLTGIIAASVILGGVIIAGFYLIAD